MEIVKEITKDIFKEFKDLNLLIGGVDKVARANTT